MTRLDVRNLLRPGPVAPRFTRTGRLREATGTRRAIAGWVPVYRQHRAALAVAGALHRARLTEQVAELFAHGPAGVALRLAPDCDPETTEQVLDLVDWTIAMVGRAIAREHRRTANGASRSTE